MLSDTKFVETAVRFLKKLKVKFGEHIRNDRIGSDMANIEAIVRMKSIGKAVQFRIVI